MSPCLPYGDLPGLTTRDVEHLSQGFVVDAFGCKLSQSKDLLCCQFGESVTLPLNGFRTPMCPLSVTTQADSGVHNRGASLDSLVALIGGVGAKPKVPHPAVLDAFEQVDALTVIPDAPWNITGMADAPAGWRPFVSSKPPSEDVGAHMSLIGVSKLAVPVFVGQAGPCPAIVADCHLGPKTLIGR